jgi:hypothetical protein
VNRVGLRVVLRAEEIARGIRPAVRVRVGQRHVADAQPIERREGAERVLDRVSSFDPDEHRDLCVPLRAANLRDRAREDEVRPVGLDETVDQVRELERLARGAAFVAVRRRHVVREERRGDSSLSQPRDVDVDRRAAHREIAPLALELLGHVLVRVDDDRVLHESRGEHPVVAGTRRRAPLSLRRQGRAQEEQEQSHGSLPHGATGYTKGPLTERAPPAAPRSARALPPRSPPGGAASSPGRRRRCGGRGASARRNP